MKNHHIALAFCAALATVSPAVAQDVTADTVVATVNGTDITIGHMIVLRDGLPEQYKNLPDDVLFDGILEQLVQQTVLAGQYQDKEFAIRLRMENEERSLRAGAAIDLAISERVTDEALEALYQERFVNADPEQEFNASHILVETQEEAQALIDELAGGADFATLAKEHSTGPSGPNGGELGWFGKGMMVAPFENAVVALEKGAVSEPVQTQFGWHVIILNDTRVSEAPAFDTVRADLIDELSQTAVQETIDTLTAAATVSNAELPDLDPAILRDLTLVDD